MNERTDGAVYFRNFAGFARAGGSPLYERLALAAAEDEEMLAFASLVRRGQPQINTLLGAVHFLLLKGVKHQLANYFPSCGGTRAADEDDPYGVFRDFVATHRGALASIISIRATNTNEVARSALLYPALDLVARETGAPLHMIEIGPSAGLNLNWHRYGYRYTDDKGRVLIERNGASELVLEARLLGDERPALASEWPRLASAIGIERDPVDLSDPEARLWLRALVWPERTDRLRRLDAALAVARRHPPAIVAGDAVKGLGALLAELPRRVPAVLVHTLVTYQFDPAAEAALEQALCEASRARPLYRVFLEWDGKGATYPLGLARYDGEARTDRVLARCDAHGAWLRWLGSKRGGAEN